MPKTRYFAFALPLLGMASFASQAAAEATSFFSDGYLGPETRQSAPVRRVRHPSAQKHDGKAETVLAEGRKPQGPLVIAVSIQRQQVKVYDANGLFAQSPISSGMAGHATPMGVFSVIQKHKFHRSNIYSGAPMPYMQRITWSGIAMHAGVLPGYPASHGCIRMPMSFAVKMWSWTRMGGRVVVTPGEVSPVDFANPLLASLVPPVPTAEIMPSSSIKTADASGSIHTGAPKVMADVASNGVVAAAETPADVASVASIAAGEAATDMPALEASANDGLPPPPEPAPVDFSDLKVESDAPKAATDATVTTAAEGSGELSVTTETAASAAPSIAPVEAAAPAATAPAKDQAQLAPETAPVVAMPLIKRNQPVAIFISRKDAKIYVRQDFKPVLDMPIEIAAADRPLGTHVFTARPANDNDKALQWSVVSMPAVARQASAVREERGVRRSATSPAVQVASSTPDEALGRLTLPADLMARLGEPLPPGSSLIVSDQGIAQGETGEGTDFIVRLR